MANNRARNLTSFLFLVKDNILNWNQEKEAYSTIEISTMHVSKKITEAPGFFPAILM